jgi:hypothetical protein
MRSPSYLLSLTFYVLESINRKGSHCFSALLPAAHVTPNGSAPIERGSALGTQRKCKPADERVAKGEPRFRLCPPFGEIKWLRVAISTKPPPHQCSARFDRSLLIVIDWHWLALVAID